eukprot:scaffold711_cov116-Skeletonema_marinoi.AAC.3
MKKGGVVGEHLVIIKKIAKDPSLDILQTMTCKYFVLADKSSLLGDIHKKIDDQSFCTAFSVSPPNKSNHTTRSCWVNLPLMAMMRCGVAEKMLIHTDADADAGADKTQQPITQLQMKTQTITIIHN